MAKHPVPKKKVSQARTAMRYGAFAHKKHVLIRSFVQVVTCKSCGNPTLNQHACKACGNYRGRSLVSAEKVLDKVTKIKA